MLIESRISDLPVEITHGIEAKTSDKKPGTPCGVPKYRGLPVQGMGKRLYEGSAYDDERLARMTSTP
jgi:hypothetical protein